MSNHLVIEPRKKWPSGMRGDDGKNTISPEYQLSAGLSLCAYNDGGWGKVVKQGKYEDGRFNDELVTALVHMIRQKLTAEPHPTWVTCVPSRRRPELVPDLAKRVAAALGLSYVPALHKVTEAQPQKAMYNSYHQARNARESMSIREPIPEGPVILLDDVVDSRWTLTVCGYLLKQAGCGPVYPITLATATTRGGND